MRIIDIYRLIVFYSMSKKIATLYSTYYKFCMNLKKTIVLNYYM